ncbi:MAG: hypothetical protein J6L62_02380 [Clostridia bacterium]|nr:hypothetical protein [Clostridia bacterium]
MIFNSIRWAVGIFIFFLLLVILMMVTKKTGKSALISAFVAVILVAVSSFVPVENYFYSFADVEQAFSYRYHEELITYAECDEGALCVSRRDEMNYFYYSLPKDSEGYKLPNNVTSKMITRSSAKGVYMFEKFENQTIILTQILDSEYNGEPFVPCSNGYYTYTVVDGDVDYTALSCAGEKVKLV